MDSAHGGPLAVILRDLQGIFSNRLDSFVAYGRSTGAAASLVLVRTLTVDDLTACAARAGAWHRAGAATPLLLARDEFAKSLDAFPIEYGEILDTHRVLFGQDPFAGLAIDAADVRRACEVQVKSHLLHLRENYVDCGAHAVAVRSLVAESAPAFAVLLRRLAALDGHAAATAVDLGTFAASRCGLDPRVVGDVLALMNGDAAAVDALRLFPGYVAVMEHLAQFVDGWTAA